jgi:hypothetical protein
VPRSIPTPFAEMLSASLLVSPSRWWEVNRQATENPMPMTLRTTNRVTVRARSSELCPRHVQKRLPR